MSILGYSTSYFIPQWWKENSRLWGEKLIPLWDWFLSNDNPEKDKVSDAFYQVVNKHINTQELPLEGLVKYIQEMGYGYITDFFQPDEEAAKKLVAFLVLIHFLKGSRKGLELILSIMGVEATITEWWETTPVGVVDTFELRIIANTLNSGVDSETFKRFNEFIRNYVYPEVNVIIIYDVNIGNRQYMLTTGTGKLKYTCSIDSGI